MRDLLVYLRKSIKIILLLAIAFLIIIGILFFLILLITLMANEFDNGLPSSRRRQLEIINKQ